MPMRARVKCAVILLMTIFHLLSTRRDPDTDKAERERARAADERARLRAIVRAEIDAALDDPDDVDDVDTTKDDSNG